MTGPRSGSGGTQDFFAACELNHSLSPDRVPAGHGEMSDLRVARVYNICAFHG
jgi:hypothetical protein